MPTVAEDVAAAKAAQAILQLAYKEGWLDRLTDIFKTKHKVLVLGSTGTGKTNLIRSLQTLVPKAVDRLQRTAYAESQRIRVAGTIFDFMDTPGQDAHRARRFEAITDMLNRPGFGLINVTSWGYHEHRTGKDQALIDGNRPNPIWLEDHRSVELRAATEWAPIMMGKPSYIITLVTKADLWWQDYDEVLEYYEKGPYFKTIRDAAINGHSVIPYSSVNHLFYDTAACSGLFSDKDHAECQEELLKELFMATARA